MMTENEIRNQLAIAQSKKEQAQWGDKEDQWALFGYIQALGFVLGTSQAKYDKDDI